MRTPVARLLALLLIMVGLVVAPSATPALAHHRGAEIVAITQVAERQVDLTVRSVALGGREVKVRLLTPDGWNPDSPRQHWPTLWLLHGCCGDYTSWTSATDVAETEALRDVLVVMPEAGWNGWYSNWWGNGGDNGQQWETFHLRELRPLLEREFAAGPKRVVAGLSMGGQGSLLYAARYPGMFRAAAAFSGSAHPLDSVESIERLQGFFAHDGNDPDDVWGDPVAQPEVWEQHDPYHLAERLTDIPIYLSCGDGSAGPYDTPGTSDALEADFHRQNVALAERLDELGADVTTNFYGPGQHKWAYWERELHASLPMLMDALD